jgi:hypothetical protein
VFAVTIYERDKKTDHRGQKEEAANASAEEDSSGALSPLPGLVQLQRGRAITERRGRRLPSLISVDAVAFALSRCQVRSRGLASL